MEEKTIHDGLLNRRSIRDFSEKPIPVETLKEIVEEAKWAPSWANTQPWKLYIATGKTAAEIREAYKNGKLKSKIEVHSSGDWGDDAQRNMGIWWQQLQAFLGSDVKNFGKGQNNLFNAQAIAVITIHKNAPAWELFDAGAFEQSLLLSAYNHGVDSIVAVAFVAHADFIREKLSIPDDETIVMGIGLGYRSENKINDFKSERKSLENLLVIKD